MQSTKIGEVHISVQNEPERNEDVYSISGNYFQGICEQDQIKNKVNQQMEDPERYFFLGEGPHINVYSKQPDAMVGLAMWLNEQKGNPVSRKQVDQVREQLICLQK